MTTADEALQADLEALKILKAETARRIEKKRQSTPGIDADGQLVNPENGLLAFIRYFWDVLEPETKLIEGWPMESICQHLEAVTLGKLTRLLMNVPPGFSKPVCVDEPVLTKRGRIRLGDVLVGDEILTHRGRFRRVSAVHEQGRLPLLRLTTGNGRTLDLEKSHPVLTTRGWVGAGDLQYGDILAVVIPEEDPFGAPVTPEEARLLGYLVGDGGLSHSPMFTNSDEEIIADFCHCAATLGIKISVRRRYARWVRGAPETKNMGLRGAMPLLRKHGLVGKSSYTKRIPPLILAANKEILANFIGAYWSCDGHIKIRHRRKRGDLHLASCTTVSYELARDIQHALLRLGINARLRHHRTRLQSKKQPGGIYSSYNVFSATHDNAVKFRDMPGLCSRKNAPLKGLTPQRFRQGPLVEDELIAIEDVGVGYCRCLTVEEDHSFTASDLAVKNTLITQIFWPAWEWSAMNMPHLRYVAFSYSGGITEDRNVKFRTLVQSQKFREMWGDKFELDKVGETRITNNKTGSKFASSTTGIGTGERGDRVILDDPHSVKGAESDTVRKDTVQWFRETMSNRLNDPERSAIVIIMQRVHQDDVSGYILENLGDSYCHLMIPMRFEAGRIPNNSLEWTDPRIEDGELAWPERFPEEAVRRDEAVMGSFATAAQLQQRPAPRGGGIIEFNYWQEYSPENAAVRFGANWPAYPPMSFTVLSVDTAQTEKKLNDPSAAVLLGVCQDVTYGRNQIILMHAWAARLEFFDLCNKVEETCKQFRVNKVLIEDKASGLPLAQELRRRGRAISDRIAHGKAEFRERADFGIVTLSPEGDKIARLYAVQNLFEAGVIWAPCDERSCFKTWADKVMVECAEAPKGRHDDLMDCMTQALLYLRKIGVALMPDDNAFAAEDASLYRRPQGALYPGFS